ncbi:trans-AT polyketide synthase/acyltransferase/oxidoreductase domain-containing protein [Streptomyces ambofaciens]
MTRQSAWLFPGQGAQRRGMGRELFDRYPDAMAAADRILGFSVRELCLGDAAERLTDTRYLQPALFVVNELTRRACAAREPAPDYLAGHSLGEYNALLAADAFDFETGLALVARRGELMGRATGGAMTAVVGPGAARIVDLLAEAGIDDVDLANLNSAEQVVLSGPAESLRRAAGAVTAAGAGRCVPLRVSAAFHSRYMADAAREFAAFLAGFELRDPRIPVIANVTARPYRPGEVGRLLAAQVHSAVRWSESMGHLRSRGVDRVVEQGPGRVLTGLWDAAVKDAANCSAAEPRPSAGSAPAPAGAAAAPDGAPTAGRAAPAVPAPAVPATVAPAPAVPAAAPAAGSEPSPSGARAAGGTATPVSGPPAAGPIGAAPERLGSAAFRADYGVRYAYLAGSMYKGIASTELVARMARAGLLGYFGTGGLRTERIEAAIATLRAELGPDGGFGMNLLHALHDPPLEEATVRLFLRHRVRFVEASGFTQPTRALVLYRLSGAHRDGTGRAVAPNRLLAKVSRPEVATAFMEPPPQTLVRGLLAEGLLTAAEAEAGRALPLAGEVCAEADSAGHTDAAVAYTLMPATTGLRDRIVAERGYPDGIRVGAAGGLGAPESLAAAFVLGADFVVTGSVNQCTPQAGTSDAVKDLLAQGRRPGHRVRPGRRHVRDRSAGAGAAARHAVRGARQQAVPGVPPVRRPGGDRRQAAADDRGRLVPPRTRTGLEGDPRVLPAGGPPAGGRAGRAGPQTPDGAGVPLVLRAQHQDGDARRPRRARQLPDPHRPGDRRVQPLRRRDRARRLAQSPCGRRRRGIDGRRCPGPPRPFLLAGPLNFRPAQ